MGCGASKVAPQIDEETKPLNINGNKIDHKSRSNGHANGSIPTAKSNGTAGLKSTPDKAEQNGNLDAKPQENNQNNGVVNSISNGEVLDKHDSKETLHSRTHENQTVAPQSTPVAKPVAFDIVLGKNDSDKLSPLNMQNRPPRRLKKIESAPVLTRQVLEQKQAAAEQNRQKELDKKVKLMSKRRSELLLAREMDKAQQQKAELEIKLYASERKREKTQAEIVAKQRRREEKAKRVRNKAKQMKEGDDVVDFAVDHDETYNADEEDESWDVDTPKSPSIGSNLNDDNNNQNLDDREAPSPNKLHNNETRTNEEERPNDVHDFFDS